MTTPKSPRIRAKSASLSNLPIYLGRRIGRVTTTPRRTPTENSLCEQVPISRQPSDKRYCLKWTDFGTQLRSHFALLYNARRDSADTSIDCGQDHKMLSAHQLVLSLGSLYFREALQMVLSQTATEHLPPHEQKHATVIVRHVSGHTMEKILDFLYLGQVSLGNEHELKSFFTQAEYLKLVGIQHGKYSLSSSITVVD